MTDDAPRGANGPLERIYTMAEAAKAMGIGRQKLEALVVRFPYYTANGNRKLFTAEDIKALWLAERKPMPTPLAPVRDDYASLRRPRRRPKGKP